MARFTALAAGGRRQVAVLVRSNHPRVVHLLPGLARPDGYVDSRDRSSLFGHIGNNEFEKNRGKLVA